ncbi:hypothetical protein ACP70R_015841 [Stipagrostis hirtigluma subsp. patula]
MEGGGVEAPDGVVVDPVRRPPRARRYDLWGGDDLAWGAGDDDAAWGGDDGVDDELEDAVCALCADGGLLLGCEGPCLRFFHATREADNYSGCSTLGFTPAQVEAMEQFFCTNCIKKQHRCAGCGVLGSSDAANAQVFRCSHVNCGRFYHPACIGAQLHPEDPMNAARCADQVAAGVVFECLRPHRAGYNF